MEDQTTTPSYEDRTPVEIGKKLFSLRDYTPIPLILLLLLFAEPSVISATVGTLLVVMGELIRIYSVAFIGSISRTRSDNLGGKVVRTGPFGVVRNPLYVGNFFITVGLAFFGGVFWLVFLAAALFAVQYFYIVKYEEDNLVKSFGEDYKSYRTEVPAWIPRKKIKLSELEWPSDFSKALKSEKRTLSAIAVMLFVLAALSRMH